MLWHNYRKADHSCCRPAFHGHKPADYGQNGKKTVFAVCYDCNRNLRTKLNKEKISPWRIQNAALNAVLKILSVFLITKTVMPVETIFILQTLHWWKKSRLYAMSAAIADMWKIGWKQRVSATRSGAHLGKGISSSRVLALTYFHIPLQGRKKHSVPRFYFLFKSTHRKQPDFLFFRLSMINPILFWGNQSLCPTAVPAFVCLKYTLVLFTVHFLRLSFSSPQRIHQPPWWSPERRQR